MLTSILTSSSILEDDKPIIALTSAEDGTLKISGRAMVAKMDKKLNLGAIFQEASSRFDGRGGGHDAAAGAQLPQDSVNDFVQLVDQMVGLSLNKRD